MNRRTLVFGGLKLAAVASIAPELFLTGCNQSDKTRIAQLVQILGTAAANVATAIGDVQLAGQIKAQIPAVVDAIEAWQIGTGAPQTAIQALNALVSLLYLIPQVGPYLGLIQLAIATAEALIALIPAPQSNDIASRATKPGFHPSQAQIAAAPKSAKEFKAQFNAIAKSNPQTASLALK